LTGQRFCHGTAEHACAANDNRGLILKTKKISVHRIP
jgi:hypothetical protein